MKTRVTNPGAMLSRLAPAVAVLGIVAGAVIAASAGPVQRSNIGPISAPDDVEPCPEDGSFACHALWAEYIACILDGGTACVVPCCSIRSPDPDPDSE